MYFLFRYKNRRIKPDEIVLRRKGWGKRENMERVNPTKIYYKHICKYHNVYYNYYMLIKLLTKKNYF
jgi:hypothetical protein